MSSHHSSNSCYYPCPFPVPCLPPTPITNLDCVLANYYREYFQTLAPVKTFLESLTDVNYVPAINAARTSYNLLISAFTTTFGSTFAGINVILSDTSGKVWWNSETADSGSESYDNSYVNYFNGTILPNENTNAFVIGALQNKCGTDFVQQWKTEGEILTYNYSGAFRFGCNSTNPLGTTVISILSITNNPLYVVCGFVFATVNEGERCKTPPKPCKPKVCIPDVCIPECCERSPQCSPKHHHCPKPCLSRCSSSSSEEDCCRKVCDTKYY